MDLVMRPCKVREKPSREGKKDKGVAWPSLQGALEFLDPDLEEGSLFLSPDINR